MNEELVKALTSLIDETIVEIEDLKKSRFSASEVKIKGPGEDGLKGHPADGKLDKEEDKDEKGEDDKDKDDKKDVEKADVVKADDEKKEKKEDDKDDKKEDKKEEKEEKKEMMGKAEPKEGYEIKKSLEAHDALMKSYIDGRITTLEGKLGGILDLVKKIADQPVAPKGASAKNFQVLTKGANEVAPLSKSQVADKLFELKKSGKPVDSADITAAELGSTDLNSIITKYGLQ